MYLYRVSLSEKIGCEGIQFHPLPYFSIFNEMKTAANFNFVNRPVQTLTHSMEEYAFIEYSTCNNELNISRIAD